MSKPNYKEILYDLCRRACLCETQGDMFEAVEAAVIAAGFATREEASEIEDALALRDFLDDYRDEALNAQEPKE